MTYLSTGTFTASFMKIGFFLFLTLMPFIIWPGVNAAQQVRQPAPKVSPGLWKKAHQAGTVRVIVDLNVPGWTSKKLSQEDQLKQQTMVADVQAEVLRELTGTQHKVTAQFKIVRGIGLEVGVDALAVLERSTNVIKVNEDAVLYLQ
jgi:hypothetical protein